MWFVKSRRVRSDDDYETWIEGGVSPTLTAFDNGDVRATTVIIAFDNSYRDGIRIQKGETINTLSAKMGTGGNNVPFIAHDEHYSFDTEFGGQSSIKIDQTPPLKVKNTTSVAIPIDTRNALRDPEKHDAINRQGLGVGQDGDPSPTLTNLFVPAVAATIPIQDGRPMDKKQNGIGIGEDGEPSYTLDQTGAQSIASDADQTHMIVRRLTPLECERLMGWDDNHTLHRADGKLSSDSARYKMCGNGVASPVAQWIGEQIIKVHTIISTDKETTQ